jgi:diadenosine tetraphosphatase ApaH/serine/threonine PP2A family protein phosphatase
VRYLILSDIHANRQALDAVIEAAEGRYDRALCCGDLVGYGADPDNVAEWVRAHCAFTIRGNHDRASTGMEDLEWFNPVAREAAVWTQLHLSAENAEWIRSLPQGPLDVEDFQLIHGAPQDEDEYVLHIGEAHQSFGYLERRLAFFGHTHVQGGFIWNQSRVETIPHMGRRSHRQVLEIDPACAYLLNPGSVGQPRDADPRAAFALFDSGARMLTFVRVPYDIATAQERILEAGLPPALAERLMLGR